MKGCALSEVDARYEKIKKNTKCWYGIMIYLYLYIYDSPYMYAHDLYQALITLQKNTVRPSGIQSRAEGVMKW